MPWWLVYYVGNIYEIKMFIGALTFFGFVGGFALMMEKRIFSLFILSLFLFALLMLLPDGRTAINIYNSVN